MITLPSGEFICGVDVAADDGTSGAGAGGRSILVVMATVVARPEADFIASRDKLLAAGKPKMVVRIALARKLLVRLDAKARDARAELDKADELQTARHARQSLSPTERGCPCLFDPLPVGRSARRPSFPDNASDRLNGPATTAPA